MTCAPKPYLSFADLLLGTAGLGPLGIGAPARLQLRDGASFHNGGGSSRMAGCVLSRQESVVHQITCAWLQWSSGAQAFSIGIDFSTPVMCCRRAAASCTLYSLCRLCCDGCWRDLFHFSWLLLLLPQLRHCLHDITVWGVRASCCLCHGKVFLHTKALCWVLCRLRLRHAFEHRTIHAK